MARGTLGVPERAPSRRATPTRAMLVQIRGLSPQFEHANCFWFLFFTPPNKNQNKHKNAAWGGELINFHLLTTFRTL